MKKLISMILIMVLVFSTVSVANAAQNKGAQGKPRLVKVSSYNIDKIKLTWEKAVNASGYKIYRATSKSGSYKLIATINNPDKTTYINGFRTTGKTYFYKIRVYMKEKGKSVYTGYSKVLSAYSRPRKVAEVNVKLWENAQNCFLLDWNDVKGADGYQLQVRSGEDEKWRYYGESNGCRSYPDISEKDCSAMWYLDKDKDQYQFRVRAFTKMNGKKVYGLYSAAETIKAKWTADDLSSEITAWVKEKYPEADIYEDSIAITPEEGSSWGPTWAWRTECAFEELDSVTRKLEHTLEGYFRVWFDGDAPSGCLYIREIQNNVYRIWWLD